METETIDKLLLKLKACTAATDWTKDKSWKEIYETCHRGDWLLWLFTRTNPEDLQLLVLAKGHCANTVRHLMKDERSIKAVDAAISFGEGKITINELHDFADAADADAAAYAADAAAYADAAYAADAYAANVADAAAYAAAYAAAKKENQLLTANICRKYLPIEIWKLNQ